MEKIINYCWFGKTKKPKKVNRYINTWKKIYPDYKIIEWNEDNFDVNFCKFSKDAYENKKYAFVADVCRLYALKTHGGIYLDTDVEAIKRLPDEFLTKKLVLGFEDQNKLGTNFLMAEQNNEIIDEFLNYYINKEYKDGNTSANTVILTGIIKKHGYDLTQNRIQDKNLDIYPIEYFTGADIQTYAVKPTENTYFAHHFMGSWLPFKTKLRLKLYPVLSKILGKERFVKLKTKAREKHKK